MSPQRATDPLISVEGKTIVVSGAASGLGNAIAAELSRRGARLGLLDLDARGLEAAGAQMNGALPLPADITDAAAVSRAVKLAAETLGPIDGAVNAAGILTIGDADNLDEADFRRCIDINLTGAFVFSKAIARSMGDAGGRIVHIASVSSMVSNLRYAAYASSKAALSQMVRVLAREWAPRNILVNAIGPAVTETRMTDKHLDDPAFRDAALSVIPMGRFGTPEDLFGMVLLLLAEGGSFITGQTLYIDGGRTLV